MSEIEGDPGRDVVICRCEDVARWEILEAIAGGAHTMSEVKWRTRAGMGLCQGKTCQRLVSQIIAQEIGMPVEKISPSTSRAPVRPTYLGMIAREDDGNDGNA